MGMFLRDSGSDGRHHSYTKRLPRCLTPSGEKKMQGWADDQESRAQVAQARSTAREGAREARRYNPRPDFHLVCAAHEPGLERLHTYGKHGGSRRHTHDRQRGQET